MHEWWDYIIGPGLQALQARKIIEIGVEHGKTTKHLAAYTQHNNAELHAIDVEHDPVVQDLQQQYPRSFTFYQGKSLHVLPALPLPDVVFIDGDHNWYTVFHELKVIERMATGNVFPTVFLHDTSWPYDWRDQYTNPEDIPEQYRQPFATGGVSLKPGPPQPNSGLNHTFIHSVYAHGIRTGVRAAVQDFLNETPRTIAVLHLPGFHGLSVLIDEQLLEQDAVATWWQHSNVRSPWYDFIAHLEQNRLQAHIDVAECAQKKRNLQIQCNEQLATITLKEKELQQAQQSTAQLEQQTTAQAKNLHQLKNQFQQTQERLEHMTTGLEQKKAELLQRQKNVEHLQQQLNTQQQAAIQLQKQLTTARNELNGTTQRMQAELTLVRQELDGTKQHLTEELTAANTALEIKTKQYEQQRRELQMTEATVTNLEQSLTETQQQSQALMRKKEEEWQQKKHALLKKTEEQQHNLATLKQQREQATQQLDHIQRTLSWRLTAVFRKAIAFAKGKNLPKSTPQPVPSKPLPYRLFSHVKKMWIDAGSPFPDTVMRLRHSVLAQWWPVVPDATSVPSAKRPPHTAKFCSPAPCISAKERAASLGRIKRMPYTPHITIVVIIDLFDEITLRQCLNSITEQTYSQWRVLVACTSTEDTAIVPAILQEYKEYYPDRFHLIAANNKFDARNKAIENSQGLYTGLLPSTDTLQPHALEAMITQANLCAQWPDVITCDHSAFSYDKDRKYTPHHKPQWSPELLLSYNYVGQWFMMKRERLQLLINPAPPSGQAYWHDLLLRFDETEHTSCHTPVLLHYAHVERQPTSADIKTTKSIITQALERRKLPHQVEYHPVAKQHQKLFYRLKYQEPSTGWPSVTILIPTKDRLDLLQPCLESIRAKTTYPNYNVVIINNNSEKPETEEYLKQIPEQVLTIPTDTFNFAYINNEAVRHTQSDYILLLNNDITIRHQGWLTELMGAASLSKNIGVVGGKLLYGYRNREYDIQSIGMIVGRHWASLIKIRREADLGYGFYNHVLRNCSAVSGACLLTPRHVFDQLHGLDDTNFSVDFNDVDYCLRAKQLGYRTIVNPQCELDHYESATRGNNDGKGANVITEEWKAFERKWSHIFGNDPYYNPNFSLHLHDDAFTLQHAE